jgi:hypothetical protein
MGIIVLSILLFILLIILISILLKNDTGIIEGGIGIIKNNKGAIEGGVNLLKIGGGLGRCTNQSCRNIKTKKAICNNFTSVSAKLKDICSTCGCDKSNHRDISCNECIKNNIKDEHRCYKFMPPAKNNKEKKDQNICNRCKHNKESHKSNEVGDIIPDIPATAATATAATTATTTAAAAAAAAASATAAAIACPGPLLLLLPLLILLRDVVGRLLRL